MQTSGNAQALQRLLLDEALADELQHGHLLRRPFDLAFTRVGKPDIFHITLFEFCRSHCWTPRDLDFHLRGKCLCLNAPQRQEGLTCSREGYFLFVQKYGEEN